VLIVDDDDAIRLLVARSLSADGFQVDQARDAPAAREALTSTSPDLVVLDVMMPMEDGLELLLHIRRSSEVPVLMLTGRGEEHDRILGLKLGADDYLVKPFSPAELSARITSILRRTRGNVDDRTLAFGDLIIDTVSREVRVEGTVVATTAKEFDLLAFLAASPRQVFSRDQILRQVWESSSDWQDTATVTEHVRRLRRKIEADPDNPRWLQTVRSVGYRFEPS
jgi:DNA-binding response OmpR family regulator